MATGSISSLGIGSGIDLNSLLSQLMAAERTPIVQIQQREASYNSKLSAYGTMKSYLSSLQTAAEALSDTSDFAAFTTKFADDTVATGSASSSASAGTYSLEVTNLAEFQKVKSAGYSATTSAVTTDTLPKTLTIALGTTSGGVFTSSSSVNIQINSSNNTLGGIRDAINAADAGVTASIINDGGASPYRLVLTAKNSGTQNTFRLSGLDDFNYTPATGTGTGLSTIQAAEDATFLIDSMLITKQSNTVTDAIEGVTLNLTKSNTGSPTTLTVTQDGAAIEKKVKAFVDAYNKVIGQIRTDSAYNETTKKAGILNGDSTARTVQKDLRSIVGSNLTSGTLTRLSEVGIQIAVDGTMSLNSTTFQDALADPTKNVAALFGTSNGITGFAAQIAEKVEGWLEDDGLIDARTDGINAIIKSYDKRIEDLEARLLKIEDRYRRQFAALDSMIAGFNSTSSFLTQQINQLNANRG